MNKKSLTNHSVLGMDIQALFQPGTVSVLQLHFIKMLLLIFYLHNQVSYLWPLCLPLAPIALKPLHSGASRRSKSSGNRLRHYLHATPSTCTQHLTGIHFPFHFPGHFLTVSNLCVFCLIHSATLRLVPLRGWGCNQLSLISASNYTHVHLSLRT